MTHRASRGAVAVITGVALSIAAARGGLPTVSAGALLGGWRYARLARALAARDRDLEALRHTHQVLAATHDEARRATEAKSAFLSAMTHELRTPLHAVLGFAQLLAHDELTADQAENVAHIQRAGHHLLILVNDGLDVARIEAGKLDLAITTVALPDILATAHDLIRPQAATRGITLTVAVPHALTVRADATRLVQVVVNLLDNAVKYNTPGGTITIFADASAGTVALSVTDTGPGIAPTDLDRLFIPFDRLGADRTDIVGTGIGLTLARLLTQQMGGSLTVFSQLGTGSTFTIELAAPPHPSQRPPHPARRMSTRSALPAGSAPRPR